MQFPNAQKGIKRIFTAEILGLIASLAGVITAVLTVVTLAAAASGSETGAGLAGIGTGVFIIAAGVLMLIAFIMNIVGISNASKDEDSFKQAMLWLIIGIVASVVMSLFQSSNEVISNIASTLTQVCNLLSTYYVIVGIISLADRRGDAAVSELGHTTLKLIVAVYVVLLIIEVIAVILSLTHAGSAVVNTASTIGGILGIAAAIVSIVSYIIYLRLLSQAKKMLA